MIWFRKHITQEARVTHEAHTIQHRAQRIAMLKSTWTTVKSIFTLTINKKSTEQTKHNDTAHTYDTLAHFLPYNKPIMWAAFLSFLWQTTRGGTPCGLGLNHPGALSRTVRLLIRRISTITQTPFPHLLPLCLPSDIGRVGKKWQPRNPVSTFFWGQIWKNIPELEN